jgi:hypothetical protein
MSIGSARLAGPPNDPCPWFSGQIKELRWFRLAWEEYAGRHGRVRRSPGATDAPVLHYNKSGECHCTVDVKSLVVAWSLLESNLNHAAESVSGESPLPGPEDKNRGN